MLCQMAQTGQLGGKMTGSDLKNLLERWRTLITHQILELVFHLYLTQDECWTSVKQSQVWSSTCHGQWWRWRPGRPVIIQIFCKQLWSQSKWQSKMLTHCHPDWCWFLWWPYSGHGAVITCKKSNFCLLETSLTYFCSDSKKCFLHVPTKSRKSKRKIEQPIMYVGVYMAYGESGFFIWTLVQFFCKSMLQFYWTACICNLAMKLPHTSLILCIFFQSGPSQNGWPSPLWISPGDQFHRGG